MKRILLLLLVPIVLVSGAVGQQPMGISPTLAPYTVAGDEFSVNLHSRPTLTTTKVSRKRRHRANEALSDNDRKWRYLQHRDL